MAKCIALLESVRVLMVDGSVKPLSHVAQIVVKDQQTLQVVVSDIHVTSTIEYLLIVVDVDGG